MAGLLWDEWVPDRARRIIADALPDGMDQARRLVVWLAGVHDIGKATPAFSSQCPWLAAAGEKYGLDWTKRSHYGTHAHHTVTGQLVLNAWLKDRHRWEKKQTQPFSCVVGGHHGCPPDSGTLVEVGQATAPYPLGWGAGDRDSSVWRSVQWELLDWAAESALAAGDLAAWKDVALPQQAQVLLTAIVIVADWIASNEEYFPYLPIDALDDDARVATGWNAVALPPRWQACDIPTDVAEFYRSRFTEHRPRPLQEAAVAAARDMDGPSIMVIEAPMGEGKTEAALLAAEVCAERDGSGGVVIALPTRATSNAMLTRVTNWLKRVHRDGAAALDLGLGHGKNRFNPEYQTLLRDGFACVDADWSRPANRDGRKRNGAKERHTSPTVAAHRWMAGRKKTLLAQFAVVTIDQILFAALKAKHVVMRHLGLAGKVVIIDEAHAYDVYMSRYLDKVVGWLSGYGCTVIVLSATLPAARRAQLIAAYQGRAVENPVIDEKTYPAVITAGRIGPVEVRSCAADALRATDVLVEYLDEPDDAPFGPLVDELEKALHDGGCVLVVRNTVRRAEATTKALREHFGDRVQVALAHSRFIAADRERNDTWLRTMFGADRESVTRPTIVVATQVAEQSLDIDFDLLVTDLAPIDLMLQRMGRVHRHQRGVGQSERPEPLRRARCLVTGAAWTTDPPEPASGSHRVYDTYALLRAAAVLNDHASDGECRVSLPGDIAPLVQRAYGDGRTGPDPWQEAIAAARQTFEAKTLQRAEAANTFAIKAVAKPGRSLIGWLSAGVGDADDTPDGRAQVRDGQDCVEVLLLIERDERWYLPDWLSEHGGEEVPRESVPPRRIALAALECTVALPFWASTGELIDEIEDRCDTAAWQDSHWLAGELVLALDAETMSTVIAGHRFTYSPETGLSVEETNKDVW